MEATCLLENFTEDLILRFLFIQLNHYVLWNLNETTCLCALSSGKQAGLPRVHLKDNVTGSSRRFCVCMCVCVCLWKAGVLVFFLLQVASFLYIVLVLENIYFPNLTMQLLISLLDSLKFCLGSLSLREKHVCSRLLMDDLDISLSCAQRL